MVSLAIQKLNMALYFREAPLKVGFLVKSKPHSDFVDTNDPCIGPYRDKERESTTKGPATSVRFVSRINLSWHNVVRDRGELVGVSGNSLQPCATSAQAGHRFAIPTALRAEYSWRVSGKCVLEDTLRS